MDATRWGQAFLAFAVGMTASAAGAQSFPSKPIRIVVGFPPGGPADFTARLLAEKVPGILGGNAIIENRAGENAA